MWASLGGVSGVGSGYLMGARRTGLTDCGRRLARIRLECGSGLIGALSIAAARAHLLLQRIECLGEPGLPAVAIGLQLAECVVQLMIQVLILALGLHLCQLGLCQLQLKFAYALGSDI